MGRTLSRIASAYRAVAVFFTSVCLLLVLANGLAAVVLARRDRPAEPPEYVRRALETVYPGLTAEERARLHRESRRGVTREALVQHRERAFDGAFVRVDPAGFRHGADQGPWPPDPGSWNVFVFGGSTAFGYGVRDADTIASHLQRRLAGLDPPRPPRVYNFARGGFYSTQERVLFHKLLTLGTRMDLAVFVDGLNDFFFRKDPPVISVALTRVTEAELERPWLAALARLPAARLLAATPFNVGFELPPAAAPGGAAPLDDPAALGAVIRRYLANLRLAEAVGSRYGVRTWFVWQPVPTYGYDLRHHTFEGSFGGHEASRHGYPRMRDHVRAHPPGDNFLWCADVQEGVRELLYVDQVHYAPGMSARVADCIAETAHARGLIAAAAGPVGDAAETGGAAGAHRIADLDGDGVVRIACLGDSNTMSTWQGGEPDGFAPESGWCERLERLLARPDVATVNLGLGGARAVADPDLAPGWIAAAQLDHALDAFAPDAVILAFGTNDIDRSGAEPAEVARALEALAATCRARGVAAFVALTPPMQPADAPQNAQIAALNALLRRRFPEPARIDFFSIAGPEDFFDDGIHLNARGHERRARAAADVLARALPAPAAEGR